MSASTTTQIFLFLVAFSYLSAFGSLYWQWSGLYGDDGVTPAAIFFEQRAARITTPSSLERLRALPTLAWFHAKFGLSVAEFMEAQALAGTLLAALACAGVATAPVLLLLQVLYLSLYTVGGTFLSFQWDILLLEVGAIAVLLAPWARPRPAAAATPAVWLVRFCLAKLMLMSGAVKVFADCPTWQQLTALSYHFATQCIPTPLAWHAHQLPPLLLKAGVAATFVIELPATLLLLAPLAGVRQLGASLQIFLQLLIIVTGNYNFFNVLTIGLCVPLLHDDHFGRVPRSVERLACAACVVALAYATHQMVDVSFGAPDSPWTPTDLRLRLGAKELRGHLDRLLPRLCAVGVPLLMSLGFARDAIVIVFDARAARLWRAARLVKLVIVSAAAFALYAVSAPHLRSLSRGVALLGPRHRTAFELANDLHLASGYGLFRRMTGVGDRGEVARPEVVLEGSSDGRSWTAFEFAFKPGATGARPPWVAPHQPRLDWQLWFAALGEYNSNPWLVHLAIHLLRGTPEVRALLAPRLPAFWPRGAAPKLAYGTGPPRLLRATLYHYDFAPRNASAPGGGKWWKRKRVGEYLPPLELGNPSLVTFLRQTGWATDAPRLCRRFEELPEQLLPECAADDCRAHDSLGAAQRACVVQGAACDGVTLVHEAAARAGGRKCGGAKGVCFQARRGALKPGDAHGGVRVSWRKLPPSDAQHCRPPGDGGVGVVGVRAGQAIGWLLPRARRVDAEWVVAVAVAAIGGRLLLARRRWRRAAAEVRAKVKRE